MTQLSTDHPLYAAYRRAIMSRNDEEALKILQSIVGLNPADADAASELARLDAKVLAARLQHLAGSLESAEPALVVAEIEALETFGFKTRPGGEVWRRAQAIRCQVLLDQAARLKEVSLWSDALAKVVFIHQLQEELKIEVPSAASTKLAEIETWARAEQEKDKKDRQFQSLLSELHHRLQLSEEKDTSAHYVELPEMRNDYEAMHKVWRALTDFTRPIPEDATARFRKRSALLEAEMARRISIRRRIIVAGAVAVLVAGGVIAWFVTQQMKAREFSRQLNQAVAQRQVREADRLLQRAHNEHIGDAASVAAAETFAAREHALQTNFETAFNKLPQQLTGDADAARLSAIADELAGAQSALAAVAPDLKAENEPRLKAFEKLWQEYLLESSTAVNQLLDQWVSDAEGQSAEVDYHAPLEKTTAQLAALAALARKITDTESGFTNQLSLRSDLLQRAASVRARIAACQGELQKIDDGLAAVQEARTPDGFSRGITLIASSEFATAPAVVAATAVQSLDPDADATLRGLLGITNAATWAYIHKAHPMPFVPEAVMPAEHQILAQLATDPAVAPIHQRYRLWLNADGGNYLEWVTAGLIGPSSGWNTIKAWTVSASDTTATFDDHQYGYFDGQYRLSPTQPLFRVELLTNEDETLLYRSSGLQKFAMDVNSYSKPLLSVLDTIKDSNEGSGLFKAYLFLRLMDVMHLQPDAWGLSLCPAAQSDEARIRNIVSPDFGSGDWLVPAKINAYSQKLELVFAAAKPISYMKQAQGLLALAQVVSKDGLQYGGFIGLDGKAAFISDPPAGAVLGYSAAQKKPELLGAKIGQPLRQPAMPLSPLFGLGDSISGYLAKAGVNPKDPSFQGVLPPAFSGPLQQ